MARLDTAPAPAFPQPDGSTVRLDLSVRHGFCDFAMGMRYSDAERQKVFVYHTGEPIRDCNRKGAAHGHPPTRHRASDQTPDEFCPRAQCRSRTLRRVTHVSIPEKTLEHWASQYLAYRYRSWAALWWPTQGEDIDVRWLPSRPGKAVQLELKTSTPHGKRGQYHDVIINLGQLWDYHHRPLAKQPFYVIPWPIWRGNLEAAARADGLAATEIAFSRSGDWWFANWMIVLTTAQVVNVLHKELMAHASSTRRGAGQRLVRFDLSSSTPRPSTIWGSHSPEPKSVGWRDFWSQLERCGSERWPQLIRLPSSMPLGDSMTRQELLDALRFARQQRPRGEVQELVTFGTADDVPDGGPDVFIRMDDATIDSEPSDEPPGFDEADAVDRRQVVFIDVAGARRRN